VGQRPAGQRSGNCSGADCNYARDVTVGLVTRGFSVSLGGGLRATDDFTVTSASGWQIATVDFFIYQGGMMTTTNPLHGHQLPDLGRPA
jgi:hypothetical protein